MVRLQNTGFSEKIIYFITFFLSQSAFFIPKKILKSMIISKLCIDSSLETKFFLSGRSAIKSIGDHLYKTKKNHILIPDYLCNVVQSSLEASKCQCSFYPLDENIEPNIDTLKKNIKSGQYSAIIIAPIFGSQCGLSWWSSSEAIKLVTTYHITLIFDFCQDILLDKKFNMLKYYPNSYIIYSFNDKSIPGIMGGLVIGKNLYKLNQEKISIKKLVLLRLLGVLKLKNYYIYNPIKTDNKFDYSYCKKFPYLNESLPISNYQLVVTLIGLFYLKRYTKNKKILRTLVKYKKLPESDTSSYIISTSNSLNLKRKNSYAIHHNPKKSIRPDLHIYHAKGFHDY